MKTEICSHAGTSLFFLCQPKHKKVYFLCNIVYCPCVLCYVRKRKYFFTFWLPRDPVILRMEEERKKKNKKKGEKKMATILGAIGAAIGVAFGVYVLDNYS